MAKVRLGEDYLRHRRRMGTISAFAWSVPATLFTLAFLALIGTIIACAVGANKARFNAAPIAIPLLIIVFILVTIAIQIGVRRDRAKTSGGGSSDD